MFSGSVLFLGHACLEDAVSLRTTVPAPSVSGLHEKSGVFLGLAYLLLVGNGGMEYNYNCYYYHSSIPYQPKVSYNEAHEGRDIPIKCLCLRAFRALTPCP